MNIETHLTDILILNTKKKERKRTKLERYTLYRQTDCLQKRLISYPMSNSYGGDDSLLSKFTITVIASLYHKYMQKVNHTVI